MRFIDLFAGLGGFHLALTKLGHTCVFACEKDAKLRELYKENFGVTPKGDIRLFQPDDVPAHDILCAGLPCQPFSKAGSQEGFECPSNGDLFDYVLAIVRRHEPKYLLLENVANLKAHNTGATWASIERRLRRAKYEVTSERLSPHHFGIPQIRERLFIVASRNLSQFAWPVPKENEKATIESVLEKRPPEARMLSERVTSCLTTWQAFLDAMPSEVSPPSFPIWTMEFGANYPFENQTPHAVGLELEEYRGSFGTKLRGLTLPEMFAALPSHARERRKTFPDWKIRFIQQNRDFYRANRKWIDPWLPAIKTFPSSLQKLEWNCKGEPRNIWQYVIQFRASGVRVKRRTTAPSLIAMTTTQVPIIAWERRYMTPRECARLQSMDLLPQLPNRADEAFAALGNAVNVKIVELVAEALLTRRKKVSENLPSWDKHSEPPSLAQFTLI